GHAAADDLWRIREAAQQASHLAGQLLAFSKQRRVVLHRVAVNVATARTLALLRGTLPQNIQVEAEPAEQEVVIESDETTLEQVLMNLCLNARDAMPEGGRLGVRIRAIAEPQAPVVVGNLRRLSAEGVPEPPLGGAPTNGNATASPTKEGKNWVCLTVSDN